MIDLIYLMCAQDFRDNLHDVQRGLIHVQHRVQLRKYKLERRRGRGGNTVPEKVNNIITKDI